MFELLDNLSPVRHTSLETGYVSRHNPLFTALKLINWNSMERIVDLPLRAAIVFIRLESN